MFAGRARSSLASIAAIAGVLTGACSPDEPLAVTDSPTRGAPAGVQGALRDTLSIPIGGTAVLADAGLSVTFLDVPSDSRCPTQPRDGFACFWEGSAEVALEVADGDGSDTVVLQSHFLEPRFATFGDVTLEVHALDPEPADEVLDPETTAYVVTLLVRPR